ncbi:MAG: peroxide stress protein YaaA [Planctomycetaceae bacterium]|nr:peroxide stress protein YaaA [Planctomycetaceae bacterium]
MLALIPPAKRLADHPDSLGLELTQPKLLEHSQKLVNKLKKLSVKQLTELMGISEDLGKLNRERYQAWKTPFNAQNASPAIATFKGDVYQGMKPESFNKSNLKFAQQHVRILSGLYGLLRPLDLMQPYRLEMGTDLSFGRAKNLYEFWGSTITQAVNEALEESGNPIVVNLASNEYYKAIQPKKLEGEVITLVFKEEKDGKIRIITLFAKQARGMMINHIVKQKINNIEGLKNFQQAGYAFDEALSSGKELIFVRPQPAPVSSR